MEEVKELKINIPEGYEVDKERSTFERIVFKKKSLKYKDVTEELFKIEDDCVWFITPYSHGDFFISAKQSEKLVAINRLLNVAKYLNGDWKPSWDGTNECKWTVCVNNGQVTTIEHIHTCDFVVCFKSHELAQKAIEILGENTIRLALSTDW